MTQNQALIGLVAFIVILILAGYIRSRRQLRNLEQ